MLSKIEKGIECPIRKAIGKELSKHLLKLNANNQTVTERWKSWLFEIEEIASKPSLYNFYTEKGADRDLANFIAKLKNPGSGDPALAAAFYYRLHYHVADLSFAKRVDDKVFGGHNNLCKKLEVNSIFDPSPINFSVLHSTCKSSTPWSH